VLFQFKFRKRNFIVGAATLLFLVTTQAFADFVPLGSLPGGSFYSDARGISADGKVVVGQSNSASGYETFRWTEAGGMVGLGVLPGGAGSIAAGTSADGSVVVGISGSFTSQTAEGYRWTQAGGMVGLGLLAGGTSSFVQGVSADGKVVVGFADDATRFQAFRWAAESGMVSLETPFSEAFAASADGTVIVGQAFSVFHAVRWTVQGVTDLGTVAGVFGNSSARGVSPDGSVIVGGSNSTDGFVAFRWTAATGMVSLGRLPGDASAGAVGVSSDGSVVVGSSNGPEGERAFVWDIINGIRDLKEVLISQGENLAGWRLLDARGVSADGRTIMGQGINPAGQRESWLARLTPVQTLVQIDIKPASDPNFINPRSHGQLPVAILTTDTFDATTVNADNVRFGSSGVQAAALRSTLVDVNADRRLDLLLHFKTQDTGIRCGDTAASLTGKTFSEELIAGSDSLETVGCRFKAPERTTRR
jgi:probable HAF family extracellular repeat protein